MTWLCDLALAAGMTLSGSCQPALPAPDPLPADDPTAWSYRPPVPQEEPKPAPAPAPNFPPVVIRQEIIREVPAPAPVTPVVELLGPDPLEVALQATYRSRAGAVFGSGEAFVPASLPGGNSASDMARLRSSAMPQDGGGSAGAEYQEKSISSSGQVDNSRIVTTDRYISGILETGINTQLDGTTGGPVVIQTTRDVFGYHGRNILIPKGSRLVCAFGSLDKVGSSRAPLRCSRMLLGGHRAEIFGLKSNVTDVQGGLGISGEVDNRFAERYGTAFILAGVSAAVRAASTSTTTSETEANQSSTLTTGGEELSQRLGEITASTLEQTINLTPILKVAQGTRVQIRPDTDWYIAKVE